MYINSIPSWYFPSNLFQYICISCIITLKSENSNLNVHYIYMRLEFWRRRTRFHAMLPWISLLVRKWLGHMYSQVAALQRCLVKKIESSVVLEGEVDSWIVNEQFYDLIVLSPDGVVKSRVPISILIHRSSTAKWTHVPFYQAKS